MKKRILSILLCICLLCSILSSTMVYAADYGPDMTSDVESGSDTTPLASGTCGEGVTWSLSEDYVLTISGDGPMENYVSYSRQPWEEYSYYIVRVEVGEGVTTIGDNAFWGFYDLESIVRVAGASEEEIARLQNALDQCILYKGHTPEFMNEFSIDIFSGFSMYLPSHGSIELNKFYQTLQWNIATGLVE